MFDATPLLRLYARWRNQQLNTLNPAETQKKQLLGLVRHAASTKFGKMHGFSSITSIEDYQRQVPLRKYEDFWRDFWKESFPVLTDCTWPGTIPYFPVSSGTSSGTTKYIPYSREMLKSNTKAGTDLLIHHVTNRPHSRLMGGKSFMLGGSTDLTNAAPGIYFGDLSGISVKELPWWAKMRYFPPADLALLKNWEEKIDTLASLSLEEDIRMISGVPAWMLIFFDKLSSLRPEAQGKIGRIYENLEMIVHGGVNFAPYVDRFRELLVDSHAELREVYPASEGFIAVGDRGYGDGLRMNLDHGIFFEFVPLEELESAQPTRHWIGDVQPDVNYAIILTTCAGLWSYVIGDTIRFVDTKTPRILVTGRTSYYLSAFGEHLIAEEIEDGIATAAHETHTEVSDFTVGPVFPERSGDLGGHIYVVEFANGIPTNETLEQFQKVLDARLCKRNEDYEAHRSEGFGLKAPEILPVAPGFFAEWMRQRGKLGGQNKVPRIITKLEMLKEVVDLARNSGSAVEAMA
jgi:hypothetical protein